MAPSAQNRRAYRDVMVTNVQPGESEGSLAPAPLVRDKVARSGKYGDSGIDAFCLPVHIPGRERPGPCGCKAPEDIAPRQDNADGEERGARPIVLVVKKRQPNERAAA